MTSPRPRVGGILCARRLWLLGVMAAPDRPGLAAAIFEALGRARINTQFIVQSIDLNNDSHIQFCIAVQDRTQTLELMTPIAERLKARSVAVGQPASMVSVYGPDFRERPGLAGIAFAALAAADVNILAVSTSISTISCIVADQQTDRAMAALHAAFELP